MKSPDLAIGAVMPNVQRVAGEVKNLAAGTGRSSTVTCPSGCLVTGGGFETSGNGVVDYAGSNPIGSDAWEVKAFNPGTGPTSFRAWAVCIVPSP